MDLARLVQDAQSIIERSAAEQKMYCEVCEQVVVLTPSDQHEHPPELYQEKMRQAIAERDPHRYDAKKRAKGYSVT